MTVYSECPICNMPLSPEDEQHYDKRRDAWVHEHCCAKCQPKRNEKGARRRLPKLPKEAA